MNTSDLVNALKKVPERRLRIIGLAWKIVDSGGRADPQLLSFYARELEEAISEAEAYARAAKEIVCHLREMVRSEH
jgi:hypothetical protein